MTQRELRDRVEERLRELEQRREILQRKPWTCVRLWVSIDDKCQEALGFAKVRYPDEWNEEEGIELAEKKAIAWLAKELIKEHYPNTLRMLGGNE